MATWESNKSFKFDEYAGFDYAKSELTWTYGTVADILTITTKIGESHGYGGGISESITYLHYSKEHALALLETLINWAEKYEGEGTVEQLMEKNNVDKIKKS